MCTKFVDGTLIWMFITVSLWTWHTGLNAHPSAVCPCEEKKHLINLINREIRFFYFLFRFCNFLYIWIKIVWLPLWTRRVTFLNQTFDEQGMRTILFAFHINMILVLSNNSIHKHVVRLKRTVWKKYHGKRHCDTKPCL